MIGDYDHLNSDTPIHIEADDRVKITLVGPGIMAALVTGVCESNYGVHRFLSELVRQVRTEKFPRHDPRLIEAIENALNWEGY